MNGRFLPFSGVSSLPGRRPPICAGNRYKDPKFFRMMPVRELSAGGMEYTTDRPLVPNADAVTDSSTDFQPPCLVRIRSDHKSEAQTNLCLFVVPTSPGRCRHIGCQVLVKNKEGKPPKGLAFFSLPMPKFLLHMLAPLFLHQDQVFLHHQVPTLPCTMLPS